MTPQSLLNWLRAIDKESGREMLLVHTVRNALMGASVIASTSLVAIIGVVTFGRAFSGPVVAAMQFAHIIVNVASVILVIALTEALLALRTLSRAGFGATRSAGQDDELGNAEKFARYLAGALRQLSRSAVWLSIGMATAVVGGIILAW